MTDHEPRLLDSADAATRALLESALRDRAPANGPARTAAALGLGDLSAAASTAGVFAGTGKWLAIGLFAGSTASLGSFAVQQWAQPATQPNASAPFATQPAAHAPTPAQHADDTAPVAEAPGELVRVAPAQPRPSARAKPAAVPPAPAATSLLDVTSGAMARETAWIDQARSALRRGDPASARSSLATYAAERRVGVLDREALLLGVELAVAEGDRPRASRLAAEFEAKYPNDAHGRRLRELVGKSAP